MIQYIETIPTVKEFNKLYESVGWGCNDKYIVEKAMKNTAYAICAYCDDEIVGFGRLIGDLAMFMYIQDVMVLPEFQGKQIGTTIMKHLINKINELKVDNPSIRVYVGASKDKDEFYKKFRFITREDAGLGAGMVLL